MIRVGVDVGGTFTDIVLERVHSNGHRDVHVTKVSSTPHDQSEGVVQGVVKVCQIAGVSPDQVDQVLHGTTVATNMVIERDGAKVGMLTTRGFRDILHMGRHKRPHNFSLQFDVPWQSKPLVRRRDRLPITERIMPPTGEIVVPLSEDEVKAAAELFAKRELDAVIIGFLFSFLNDEHEQRAKEIVRATLPDAYICASAEVVNTMREYERFSSTAMNAYIGPRTASYLRNLENRLRSNGIRAQVRMLQSNGGISTVDAAVELPISLLLSGPAGGVIGGRWTGESCGRKNIITIDIGGTSADISVIQDGELRIKNPRDTEAAGLPVLVPMIDIDAIGAGGGSIAYIDGGGAFRVGPRSAGSVPGPACYAKGGSEPTVTDAQVVLGRMDPEQFLGGDLKIDGTLSTKAVKEHIADKLGMSVTEAALGILKIINNNMALAINANSVAKGIDPRGYSLMGFGGAGPLHSVSLAEAIGADEVIVPTHPGITAASGLLVTDLQYEFTHSLILALDPSDTDAFVRVNSALEDLHSKAERQIGADNVDPVKARYRIFGECRYAGQGFELRAEVPSGRFDRAAAETVIDNFYNAHKQVYGHAFRDQTVQVITLRLIATVDVDTLTLPALDQRGEVNPEGAVKYVRKTTFDDGATLDTPRYDRDKLLAGDRVNGPALVLQHNSTTVIPPGYVAAVMAHGELILRRA
ncbi:hydantoinase/oxoprolinase family protein [Agrobacterium rubi]|uniref:hydantoinase/oxoprolinase family protein n=1 Tax=Agrobacterium rubi TaxID=28099 RepID=UPI0015738027|nr:hydantoinase/oxoprolinase family protein [Agrobacterium rubi]NTF10579.1 hydantoinase/oxoprolinase family protein [Agrobacterium rubi]NTF22973.1 hydantoinase/oxoprolinase family protein [Agrobacterium rubi]NTF29904.1 hydantoinase/oxoprolinase family protein [Agrobacterium rubi]